MKRTSSGGGSKEAGKGATRAPRKATGKGAARQSASRAPGESAPGAAAGSASSAGGSEPAPATPSSTGLEARVDEKLVNEAVRWIQRRIHETVHRGLTDVGEYCFTTFYGGDVDLVRASDPHKHVSFRALADRCDTVELPISKTVLYNAVAVAVITHQIPRGGAFKQLPSSHQTALLPVRDPARVERLAQRALSKELSVRQLRDIVGAEIALRDTEAPFRGRPPLPAALKSLRAATKNLKDEAGKMGWSKAQVDELSEAQAKEALRLTEGLIAALQRAAERLRER